MLDLIVVLIIGMFGGYLDAVVGAGGLFIVPSLTFLGLPLPMAIATDRLGTVGFATGSLFRFRKSKKILWKYVPIFILLSLIGSYFGANLLISIDEYLLQKIIGLLFLLVLPLLYLKPQIGIKHKKRSQTKKFFGYINYFFIAIYNGAIGIGIWPIAAINYMYLLGFTIIEAMATAIIPWFVLCAVSLIVFASKGLINYQYGIVLLLGMTIGGYLGTHTILAKGEEWVKKILSGFIIIAALKMLFF